MLVACGSRSADPPEAGEFRGVVPDLRGVPVMVLPVQHLAGIPGTPADADAEIAYALRDRGANVDWRFPDDLRRVLERSPGVRADIDNLAVGVFLQAEVERVGDPLFGEIRWLAALTDGAVALIPVQVRHRPQSERASAAVEILATLLDARSGRVIWIGVVEGAPGDPDDPAALASAAEEMARAITR